MSRPQHRPAEKVVKNVFKKYAAIDTIAWLSLVGLILERLCGLRTVALNESIYRPVLVSLVQQNRHWRIKCVHDVKWIWHKLIINQNTTKNKFLLLLHHNPSTGQVPCWASKAFRFQHLNLCQRVKLNHLCSTAVIDMLNITLCFLNIKTFLGKTLLTDSPNFIDF